MYTYPCVVELAPYIVEVKVYEPGEVDESLGFNNFDTTVWDRMARARQILDDVYVTTDSVITESVEDEIIQDFEGETDGPCVH